MDDDLRKEIKRLQGQAEDISRIVSHQGHFPGAELGQLLQELTQVLAEVVARCPRMHGKD